jgi:hypothetical protein
MMNEQGAAEREPQFTEADRQELIRYALQFGTPERVENGEADALETYVYVLPLAMDELPVPTPGEEVLRSGVLEFIDVIDERAGMAMETPLVRIYFEGDVHVPTQQEAIEKLTTFLLHQDEIIVHERYSYRGRRLGADEHGRVDFTAEYRQPMAADYDRLAQVAAQLRRRYSQP